MATVPTELETHKKKVFSLRSEHYESLVAPIALPTSMQLLEYEVETLVAKGLAQYHHPDPFLKHLPQSGLFLFVPPPPEILALQSLMELVELGNEHGTDLSGEHPKDVQKF